MRLFTAGLVAAAFTAAASAAPNQWSHEGHDAKYTYANLAERAITAANFQQLTVTGPLMLGQFDLGPASQGTNGTLFACSNLMEIRSLDGASGAQLWGRNDLPGFGCYSVAVGSDSIWLATQRSWWGGPDYDNYVMQLDAATGATRWQVKFTDPLTQGMEGPTVSGDLLVVAQRRNSVHALDANTGAERWKAETCHLNFPPAIAGGRVFVSGWTSYCGQEPALHAYDAATGVQLWQQVIRPGYGITGGSDRAPMVVGNRVVVTAGPQLKAFHTASGALKWTVTPAGIAWIAAMAAAGGDVVIAGSDRINSYDAATGAPTRQTLLDVGEVVVSNLAVTANGVFFVLDNISTGRHLAMLTKSGQVLRHSAPYMSAMWFRVSVANGRVQVTDSSGNLRIFALPAD